MPPFPKQSSVLAFVPNLIHEVKIEHAVSNLGYDCIFVGSPDELRRSEESPVLINYSRHISGPDAVLLDRVSRWNPVLIIFSLDEKMIPWKKWLKLLKSSPATRRIPVLCYGSHIVVDNIAMARELRADAVVANSQMMGKMIKLIDKYARKEIDFAIEESCDLPLSGNAVFGLELFNKKQFFEAHEFLEEAWFVDETPARDLYRALLQVAVAYHQIQQCNYYGAVKMFLRVRQWIDPLPDSCRGVNVKKLRDDAERAYIELLSLGKDLIGEFDQDQFQSVEYHN